jgi:DNA-binding transcriptional ArsR family regulator
LRADVLSFVELCHRVFFGDIWSECEPTLTRAAHRLRRRLADKGPAAALVSLSPSSARLTQPSAGPARVVFDKVHHAVINPARTPILLVPTRYGAPHLLVKNEPGLPPVVHFPVDAPPVGVTLARSRLLALTDPHRVRLCRLIARQAMTTADLANRLSMTRPQVSRHLRTLRDLGLVSIERNGRHVHYQLDLTAVERIGRDVATALQH